MADEIKQLIKMVAELKVTVDEGFGYMHKKFGEIDKRFKEVDERFDQVDKKFESIDERFDKIDKRFDEMEVAIKELNQNQIKILNSIKLIEHDIKNNKKHIERLEEREQYL